MSNETRCSICPAKTRCVPGDGPSYARVACIGEAPGKTEDDGGRPFIGDAGKEFNLNYLSLAGLDRDDIYITNTVKCRPDNNRKPQFNELMGCAEHHIPGELARVNPEIVILMGATPCKLIGGVDLQAEHGIPRLGSIFDWTGWIVPMYHPAAGLHNTSLMIPLLEDWERLRGWLEDGAWPWAIESDVARDYKLVRSYADIDSSVPFGWVFGIGYDTESHCGAPYSFQYSLSDGNARMVMLKDDSLVRNVRDMLNSVQRESDWPTWIGAHNAPADIPIADMIGLNLINLHDTMQEAYHFQNLPQGLKALARRLLGRKRKSWDETVTPHSKDLLCAWMAEGFVLGEREWRREEVLIERDRVSTKTGKALKDKTTHKIIKSFAETVLADILKYTAQNPDYNPWEKLTERLDESVRVQLIERLGAIPQKGIAHVPLDEQIEYACSDPDDTRMLGMMFEGMRTEFVKGLNVYAGDVDR